MLKALAAEVALVIKEAVAPLLVRLEALEARPAAVDGRDGRDGLPGAEGRQGIDGVAGKDGVNGTDGVDGKDGAAGLSFMGVYQDGKAYDVGHLVTWAGSSWHCNEATTTKPGDGSKAWTLMVKRGRDGKDGQDAQGALPVVKVR